MFVGICEATFRAEWVSSLKEKRMVVKVWWKKRGIIQRLRGGGGQTGGA